MVLAHDTKNLTSVMIFGYVVASRRLTDSYHRTLPLRELIPISRQLRRELLELFLRNNDSLEVCYRNIVIRNFSHDISPLIDIANHTRGIGFARSSRFFKQFDVKFADYNISQSQQPDESLYIYKGVQKLRSYHYLYGIPLHKLHITMRYTLPRD